MTLLPAFVRDCRTTTRLIERQPAGILTRPERLRLWTHLRFCIYCRRYQAQSHLLARLAPRLASPPLPPSEDLKSQWRARILAASDNTLE